MKRLICILYYSVSYYDTINTVLRLEQLSYLINLLHVHDCTFSVAIQVAITINNNNNNRTDFILSSIENTQLRLCTYLLSNKPNVQQAVQHATRCHNLDPITSSSPAVRCTITASAISSMTKWFQGLTYTDSSTAFATARGPHSPPPINAYTCGASDSLRATHFVYNKTAVSTGGRHGRGGGSGGKRRTTRATCRKLGKRCTMFVCCVEYKTRSSTFPLCRTTVSPVNAA